MRVVFAGTPRAAEPSLEAILRSRHEVAAVITRPDAPAGRGRRPAVSPVGERAAEAGLELLKPARVRDPEFLDRLRAIAPDCCPVTAYGALLPQSALDIPPHGWVNLHFSLLPAWRGAAPVQHAVLHGDDVTGATTFRIVKELDAGPVFGVVTEPIRPDDTAGDLLGRIAMSGAELLVATLDGIESGELRPQPQPADGVSLAPKIGVADARVDWALPAVAIGRLIRACTPAPGAWTELNGTRLKLGPVTEAAGPGEPGTPGLGTGEPGTPALGPGELRADRAGVLAGTGTGPVRLGEVQPAGKRRMTAGEWARGLHLDAREPLRLGNGRPSPGPD
jgi:methionyl-tRNA formyltransferase